MKSRAFKTREVSRRPRQATSRRGKTAFDLDRAITLLREATRPFPKAALFELAQRGYTSTFEQLLACLISIRTLDEVSLPAALGLFELGRTPEEVSQLSVHQIDRAIGKSTFHLQKAFRILEIARLALENGSNLTCDLDALLKLPGVGPKCAKLALGISCGVKGVGVDVHVHRVTYRWGYITAHTPEKAMLELEMKLPERYWIELNALLVPFGKHICKGVRPRCSVCPLLRMCKQVGVAQHA